MRPVAVGADATAAIDAGVALPVGEYPPGLLDNRLDGHDIPATQHGVEHDAAEEKPGLTRARKG